MTTWTSPADVRARARRRWDDRSLLRAYVLGEPCPQLDLPVRGPSAREIGGVLQRVRDWNDALLSAAAGGRAYEVVTREIGGRAVGRMTVPDRVQISTYAQFWRLLGVAGEVARLDEVVALTRDSSPVLVDWVARRAHVAIELEAQWPTVLAAVDWLAAQSGRGRYLREINAPGVDTKFIERHQSVLGELLDVLSVVAEEPSAGRSFAARRGFREPERLVHVRLDPALGALPGGIDEAALPLRHAGSLAMAPQQVLVIENQVTFLSVPVPQGGVVVWGHGYDALRLGALPWLRDVPDLRYWGDLDTHGFAILNGLRTQVPHVRSVLMDRRTLMQHRDRWVTEPRPTRADLSALAADERELYVDLVEGTFGKGVRLEQERVDWEFALSALEAAPPTSSGRASGLQATTGSLAGSDDHDWDLDAAAWVRRSRHADDRRGG
ncbi:MAG: DUF2220 family protein [Intrasporangiaceae bacterium]|nr:DUF2220 family protein [Intrasporangiaceae bacterium]